MRDLKPCPFCGGEAKLEDLGFPHHVYCTNCGARVTGCRFGEDGEEDAIKIWNMRKKSERDEAEIKLKEIHKFLNKHHEYAIKAEWNSEGFINLELVKRETKA